MTLQINKFWILKEHSTINSTNEYELDILNTFCARRVYKLKILQMYELISAFATLKFCSFGRQYLHEYYTQRAKNFGMYLVSLAL